MKNNSIIIFPLSLLIIAFLIIYSCLKDNDDKKSCSISGSVIGYNPDKCGCCPGWLIKYRNDTLKFLTIPDNDLLRDFVNFYGYPIPIRFNYKDDNSSCSDYYKIIT